MPENTTYRRLDQPLDLPPRARFLQHTPKVGAHSRASRESSHAMTDAPAASKKLYNANHRSPSDSSVRQRAIQVRIRR